MVLGIDEKRVAKIDIGSSRSVQDIETERDIYRRLNQERNLYVLWCYEVDNPSGLVLERCDDTIRKRLRSRYRNTSPPDEVVKRWVYEAAQGLAYIHRCGIIQGDVGCHNMLLSAEGTVKIGDFAGSSIDGSSATVDYEVRSKLAVAGEPNEVSDIFALGSAMWEMAMGSPPFKDESWREVHGLYKRGKFPKLKSMPELGRIIRNCWEQRYHSAQDVVYDLEAAYPGLDSRSSTSGFLESLEFEASKLSPPDRESPSKHKYVEHATNHRHKSRKYEPDADRWNERHSHKKERNREDRSAGFFSKLFKPAYTYQIRA